MKLRNKLIPFVGCLTLGATIAPASLTSCSLFNSPVELSGDYSPTITKYSNETKKLTEPQAEDVYFKAAKENTDIVAQDYNWTMSKMLKTAADNPGQLFADTIKSTLLTARQTISNISFGKTKINYESAKTGITTKEFNTISFDVVRTQTYSYTYEETIGGAKVEHKVIGSTDYEISFKNVPVNFYSGFSANLASNQAEMNYDPHLGRGLFNYETIFKYIPTEWFLMAATIPDAKTTEKETNKYVLANMKDAWEINYAFSTTDVKYTTFQGITSEQSEVSDMYGTYNDVKLLESTDPIAKEILSFRIGSYYLSDIHALI